MRKILTGLLLLLIFSVVSFAVPGQISFQGLLKDSAGNPITGTRTIDFALYNTVSGGGALWSETQTVTVEVGLYNVQLGNVTPLTATIFDGSTKYLALSIGGNELLPRVVIVTVPYALRADRATYADTAGSSGGTPNAVLFNPAAIQSTTEANAVWVRSSTSGTSGTDIRGVISAEAGGSYVAALVGIATDPAATLTAGVAGISYANSSYGISGAAFGAQGVGIAGQGRGSGGVGVFGFSPNTTTTGWGVYGKGPAAGGSFESTAASGFGVRGSSTNGTGVKGIGDGRGGEFSANSALDGAAGVIGTAISTTGTVIGVKGESKSTDGYAGWFAGGLGVILPNSTGITINTTEEGTIRYYNDGLGNTHFYGWNGTGWVQLDN